ncbi:MAG: DUF2785 domain-containing protein, partial [Anaerolineae bacterium]|nr:DUF2785 domain-containing protein [Anaerolineae bacterium]
VFLRSFSILILSMIVYRDLQESFLSEAEIHHLLDESLWYLSFEHDVRGYVPEKGWAHSLAHTADTLKLLARSPKTNAADHERILNAIADKLLLPVSSVYVYSEDERLVSAIIDMMKRDALTSETWKAWLHRFVEWKNSWQPGEFQITIHAPWLNIKTFLRSLYFRLEWSPDLPERTHQLKPLLLDVLKLYGQ